MRYILRKVGQRWAICVDGSRVLACNDLEEAFVLAWTAASIMQAAARSSGAPGGEPGDPAGSP